MNYKERYYPESKFGGFTDIDGTITFCIRVNALIESNSTVLDVGCGVGSIESFCPVQKNLLILKGKVQKVIGIDVDKTAANNPWIDEFRLMSNAQSSWPVEDNSIDILVSYYVLEHVENPDLFFSECNRVLKKEGYLCLKTANVMSYFGLISKMIPNKYHAAILKKVQPDRKLEDIFPTVYKCNTVGKVRQMLNKYGFEHCVYGYEAEPSYFSFNQFLYFLAAIHQKFAPNIFKVGIFAFAQKK